MGRLALFSIHELSRMKTAYLTLLSEDWDDDVDTLLQEVYGEFARRGL